MFFVILANGAIAYSFNDEACYQFQLQCHYVEPCQYEDGDNCYWLGDTMGNGEGRSYIAYEGRLYVLD